MIIIALGVYHDGDPKEYRAARTMDAAHAWLHGQGFRPRQARHDELSYYEQDVAMRWARVYAVADIEEDAE